MSCNRPYRGRKFVHSIIRFCNSLLEFNSKTMAFKRINFYFRWSHSTWILIECLIFLSWESSSKLSRSKWKWNRQCHSHGTRTFSFWTFAAAAAADDDLVFVVLRSDLHYSIKSSIKHFFLSLNERIEICQRERLTKRKKNMYIMHEKALVINCACEIGNQRNVCN